MRLHLPDENYLVTAALPAGRWALQHIDLFQAQNYLDYINLMSYDFTGPWTSKAGHHAQLYSGHNSLGEASGADAVNYVKSTGFPANKILLGIPLYGRSFIGAMKPGDGYSGHAGQDGTFDYKDLPRPGSEELVDTQRVAAYCTDIDGGFVTYDNPETVRMKGAFCKSEGLGGLFYWHGAADIMRGPRSLVETGFRALHPS